MTKNVKDQKWREGRQTKYDKTIKTSTLIQTQGYRLVEKWECQFRNEVRRDAKLKAFCDARKPPTPQRSVTENEILEGVASGRLFGMMELSEKPRRLLIGGMRGRQMLLATHLLKWYLEHGMVVTKIYQVVEFTPHRCFRNFVKEVSDGRRLGDVHPDKAIIADTKKVEGNNAYGGTIMDQEKFQSVTYVQGEGRVMLEANKPQFKQIATLLDQDEYFQVEKSKEKLDINLPIQIGYFILQYAKLRMLQFYYDYLDVYVDIDSAYCEMDRLRIHGPVGTYVCFRGQTRYERRIPTSTDRMLPERRRSTMVSAHLLYKACQIRQEDPWII